MNLFTHTRCDPACARHRPPATVPGRWWADRKPRACGRCQLQRARELFRAAGIRA